MEPKQPQSQSDSLPALQALQARREDLVSKRSKAQAAYNRTVFFILFVALLVPAFASQYRYMAGEIVLFFLPYLLVPFALIPFHRARLRSIDFDMQSLEFEADLLQYDASNGERRAEKILRINDIQLRRYYDLNLSQNLWIFGLGAFCILLGTAIIGVAMCVVLKAPRESKLMVAVLGGIGSILANFIAAIYLHMNAAATTNLATFHSKLVETQKLFMANLLVSRIDPDEMRWETLSQLALRIMAEPENQTIK